MTRLVEGAWRVEPEALVGFLSSRRWFGDKARVIHNASITDVVPVRWTGVEREFAVARVRVTTDEAASTYQLFLVQGEKLTDALEDAQFRRGLADAFVTGAAFENAGTRWIVESESEKPLVVPATAPVTLSSAEQTNSSVIIDGAAILKLYRKLEPGIHPDVEVTRFLTVARRFVHVPVLLGTISFEDSEGNWTAGMLQELVPGAIDGWRYALDSSREYVGAEDASEPEHPFAADAELLGTVTRAMHETLASGDPGSDFDCRPATPDDVRRWARHTEQTIERASSSLDRALAEDWLPAEQRAPARAIAARRREYVDGMTELAKSIGPDAGANTRTHGDYHLGQVLRSATARFLVIDFEGEPARPLAERRVRHSPLRDVAGMLRSFAYAAAVASGPGARAEARAGVLSTSNDQSAELIAANRAARWERGAREAFLRGYFSEDQGREGLLPHARSNAGRLLGLFEAEKLFYELQYELDHRPDWVWIPLRGITKLYA